MINTKLTKGGTYSGHCGIMEVLVGKQCGVEMSEIGEM